jgi:hypothetical protein
VQKCCCDGFVSKVLLNFGTNFDIKTQKFVPSFFHITGALYFVFRGLLAKMVNKCSTPFLHIPNIFCIDKIERNVDKFGNLTKKFQTFVLRKTPLNFS